MNKFLKSIAVVIASTALIFSASAFTPVNTSPCVTSANNGNCGPYTYSGITTSNGFNTYVSNDVWNPIAGASQTLTATDPGHWSVSANMPNNNKAVVSYPDTSQLYTRSNNTPDPLSNFHLIRSTFKDSGVNSVGPNDDYEWAYDIWEGTGSMPTPNYAQEIMIWTDNHGQRPAGTDSGSVTIADVNFELWTVQGNSIVSLVRSNESSGAVRILSVLDWLVAHNYSPKGTGLNMIAFGPELCSTSGITQTFSLSGYTITTK